MNLVFDTNVLFAAFVTEGACHALYERARSQAAIVVSEDILAELAEKLRVKIKASPADIREAEAQLRLHCTVLPSPRHVPRVCRDPDDDVILATAVAARAHALVTGDQDLLVLKRHQGIPILTPREAGKLLG